jgi:hypothetical protein
VIHEISWSTCADFIFLACMIHESEGFVNRHLQESFFLSCRFRLGVSHLAQG